MTPAECIEALREAERRLHTFYRGVSQEERDAAVAHRDRIKAAMVAHIENPSAETWRKLEEACRGK